MIRVKPDQRKRYRNIAQSVPIEKIIKAFANKRRLLVLELLYRKPDLSMSDIATELNMDIKITSAHLGRLASAGIILKRYQGVFVLHKLSDRGERILQFVRILE